MARLHKILSREPQGQVSALKLPSGAYVSDERDVLAHLINTHFPGATEHQEEHEYNH
jgi:hypothetical protein